ncbi:transducin/WD40 repeat-like superfamily protein [Actinidia rufa]|uniref:Target of rapamycin complex subunit LST8 n=1 Tax=Actinidia rufa TaxID=165716 RepID=A0A7J0E263_9ERIC|nr:transducin/WD40 repeat-like superfamily protein [Actinidia rufa]
MDTGVGFALPGLWNIDLFFSLVLSCCSFLALRLKMTQPSVILATASYDHTIRFWEAKSGRCYRTIQYPESHVNRLEITPDKSYLAAAGNPHIRLFDVNSNTPQPLASFESHTNNVMAVGFQCDGKWMYSGSEDGTVKIWDLRAPGCQREYESRAAVNTVVLHPNQTELISGDQNGNIRVWDLTANSCSCELVPEVDTAVRSLTVMWDGSLVVAANNCGTCYVWRLLQGTQTMTNFEPLHKLQAHDGYILKCLLSPELCDPNRYLATASSDGTVRIWNVGGFTLEKTLTGHQRWVWDCVFSVDGAFLITASSDSTANFGPWQLVNILKCIKGITKQPFVVLSTMELNLLADYGFQFSTSWLVRKIGQRHRQGWVLESAYPTSTVSNTRPMEENEGLTRTLPMAENESSTPVFLFYRFSSFCRSNELIFLVLYHLELASVFAPLNSEPAKITRSFRTVNALVLGFLVTGCGNKPPKDRRLGLSGLFSGFPLPRGQGTLATGEEVFEYELFGGLPLPRGHGSVAIEETVESRFFLGRPRGR